MMRNQNGLTLLEVLIAIAILGFLGIAVFTIVSQSTDSQDRLIAEDRSFVQVQSGLKRIDEDFQQLYSPLFYDSPEKPKEGDESINPYQENISVSNPHYTEHPYYDGVTSSGHPIPAVFFQKAKEIIFFTRSNIRRFSESKETSFQWVRYFVESSDEYEGFSRLMRQTLKTNIYGRELDWKNSRAFTVIDKIKKIEFFLWDTEQKKWFERIPDNGKYLGPLLRLQLIWMDDQDGENLEQKVFRILWPEFDTVEDQKERHMAKYPTQRLPNSNGAPKQ